MQIFTALIPPTTGQSTETYQSSWSHCEQSDTCHMYNCTVCTQATHTIDSRNNLHLKSVCLASYNLKDAGMRRVSHRCDGPHKAWFYSHWYTNTQADRTALLTHSFQPFQTKKRPSLVSFAKKKKKRKENWNPSFLSHPSHPCSATTFPARWNPPRPKTQTETQESFSFKPLKVKSPQIGCDHRPENNTRVNRTKTVRRWRGWLDSVEEEPFCTIIPVPVCERARDNM